MRVLTSAEMREADRRTIDELGIPGRVLMESAGRAVVATLESRMPDLRERSIAVVCGKGNNGGDGLVVLRLLATRGYRARAWVLAPFDALSPDARANLETALRLDLPVEAVPIESSWSRALEPIRDADVVVDAILGTGLTEAARGLAARAIEDLNALEAVRVAVDVPSGLASDSGAVPGAAIRADLTVALAAPKLCHYLMPAAALCGRVEVVDIGIPPAVIEATGSRLETIDPVALGALLPPRRPDAHKGHFGHLLVVAGSVGKTGAALMAAHAALRTGVGLVTVASAARACAAMAPALPEAMWEPLAETEDGAIAAAAAARVLELAAGKTAVALGPGLGRHPETVSFVRRILPELAAACVVDADGLNAFEGALPTLARGRRLALTPHPGEAARLLGTTTAEIQADRLEAARRLAASTSAAVLLKGYRSLVAEPEGRVGINLTGNAGMATGGTGDVLTGVVGSFLAQGCAPADALRLGAWAHGRAGDRAAERIGQTGLTATDLLDELPAALREVGAP